MNLKMMERATELYQTLQRVEAEIMDLERTALRIANTHTEIELHLFINRQKQERQNSWAAGMAPLSFSLHAQMMHSMLASLDEATPRDKPEEPPARYENKIGHATALRILHFLLEEQQAKKAYLLEELKKGGVVL